MVKQKISVAVGEDKKTLYDKYELWFKTETTQAFWSHLAVFFFSFLFWTLPHWWAKAGAAIIFFYTGERLLRLIKWRMKK
jgi:hypothetical protein